MFIVHILQWGEPVHGQVERLTSTKGNLGVVGFDGLPCLEIKLFRKLEIIVWLTDCFQMERGESVNYIHILPMNKKNKENVSLNMRRNSVVRAELYQDRREKVRQSYEITPWTEKV